MSKTKKTLIVFIVLVLGSLFFAQLTQAVTVPNVENPLNYNTVDEVLGSVLNYLKGIVGGLAMVFIIIGGIFYITSAGDQKKTETAKKMITAALVGLAVVLGAPSFLKEISKILNWTQTNPDIEQSLSLAQIALNVLNFLLGIIGALALIFLIIGAIMYFTSAGDENRATTGKKIVIWSIIGITVALGAVVIVTQIASLISG